MNKLSKLQADIRDFLGYERSHRPIEYEITETAELDGYTRQRIEYQGNEGDKIPAYLLLPNTDTPCPALLVEHQHAGERHFGKSEVVGLAGNPLQNFGEALVKEGFIVLAYDSICFEDRRTLASGITPHEEDGLAQFTEMCYRLVKGDTLMRKILDDASVGLSLLLHHPQVITEQVGAMGHSYGGTRLFFQSAIDERIRYVCISGAVGSYADRMENNYAFGMELAIPSFVVHWDYHDILSCIAPRPILIVSATEDPYAHDADAVVAKVDAWDGLSHLRYDGEHAMTQERYEAILSWFEDVKER